MPATTTLTFSEDLNTSLQVGDTLYSTDTENMSGFTTNTGNPASIAVLGYVASVTRGALNGPLGMLQDWGPATAPVTPSAINIDALVAAGATINGGGSSGTITLTFSGTGASSFMSGGVVSGGSGYTANSTITIPGATLNSFAGYSGWTATTGSFSGASGTILVNANRIANTVTVNNSLFTIPDGHFVFFSKDNKANLSSLLGYYAEVKMINNSRDEVELFSVGIDMFESSK